MPEVWKIIQRITKRQNIQAPQALWATHPDKSIELVVDPSATGKMWVEQFSRKGPRSKVAIDVYKEELKQVRMAEEACKIGQANSEREIKDPLTRKMFDKAWTRMQDGTPGKDLVTVKMLKEGGKPLKQASYELIKVVYDLGIVPDAFVQDVVIPLYKRGNPSIQKNYRPVSLINVLGKLYQQVILLAKREWQEIGVNKRYISHSYGGRTGRDRLMLLVNMKEMARHRQLHGIDDAYGVTILVKAGIKRAFPSIDRRILAAKYL